jgi:hypothetical protein
MLGYGYGSYVATQAIATLRERTSPNLQIKTFFDLDKVLLMEAPKQVETV